MNWHVRKNEDLHGNAPDSCPVVLLLVDVLNDVDFPGNSQLLKSINSLGKNISALKKNCKDTGIPDTYVKIIAVSGARTFPQCYLTVFGQIRRAALWSVS
jgi:hypothetical protein